VLHNDGQWSRHHTDALLPFENVALDHNVGLVLGYAMILIIERHRNHSTDIRVKIASE